MLVSIILPLSIGAVVKAFAWQIVLRRDGVVTQLMIGLGIWDEPQRLLFTETGLVLGAANIFLPFMILPIYSVVKLIDPRLSEAGATLGATPLYRFTHVTLPLTLPGVVSGMAFVFSLSVSMYVIPSLLIGDRFQTLSTLTGRSFLLMRNEQLGSTTAVDPAGAGRHHRRRLDLACPPPRGQHMTALMTGIETLAQYVIWFIAAFTVVFLMTPLVVTIAVSFGSSTVFTLPPPDWSLRWYERLANTRGLLPALITSLQVAAISTAVALVLGTLCAIALVRGRFPGREAIATFLVSPLMLPGLVIGIAMLQGFKAIGLRDVYASLLIAHVVITLPYVVRTVLGALSPVRLLADRRGAHAGLQLSAGANARAGAGTGAGLPDLGHVRLPGLDGQLPDLDLLHRRLDQDPAHPDAAIRRGAARSDHCRHLGRPGAAGRPWRW